MCPQCEIRFNNNKLPIKDHDHSSGTICSNRNLKMQQPRFVPVYFHDNIEFDPNFLIIQNLIPKQSVLYLIKKKSYYNLTPNIFPIQLKLDS